MSAPLDSAKTVFLFPGVGAQQADMFAAFRDFREYHDCLSEVSDLSGVDLMAVIHGEQRDALKQVRVSQLALTATTVAIARILRQHCGLIPDYVMGHSLGQYPALCAAGYLDLATVTRVVSLRSEAVEACARRFEQGEMCWVLHVPAETVVQAVETARREEGIEIYVSAIDAYDQATVSGEMAEIRRFAPRLEAAGALFFPLKIGGPFHSPLMEAARAQLAAALDFLPDTTTDQRVSRLVCNVSAAELPMAGLKASILQHLVSPVQWLRSQQYLAGQGVTRYLEISPKAVQGYLVQRARLPMQPLCEPQALFSLQQQASSAERRAARFFQRCCFHLYSEPLPALEDDAALQRLRQIRQEVKQRLAAAPATAEERRFLLQQTRQWLATIEAEAGVSRSLARQSLQCLYEATEG
ncbi:ACP S-malonyltransferase [Parachitinimonas caeni]|uniref:[acyl-carrier-protein] S-malonyltransferase n=1 Tax=Parachitinimonas caeni TaxID=3031301 RepID=A0ABT7DTQ6_9NEIS|nr:ACP S-malonyltransferase [Parachitinimonas caeni]MDK2123467.1 ACP S-malonyltransferase [Parachitinimonas caeni]